MALIKSIVEVAALEWFKELRYAELTSPQLAPGGPAAERESYSDVVLVGRLHETIWRLNPASCKARQASVAQPATVQSSSWLNP